MRVGVSGWRGEGEEGGYVCFRCTETRVLLTCWYEANLVLMSLSSETTSCYGVSMGREEGGGVGLRWDRTRWRLSISEAIDRSLRYLTLFQLKLLR